MQPRIIGNLHGGVTDAGNQGVLGQVRCPRAFSVRVCVRVRQSGEGSKVRGTDVNGMEDAKEKDNLLAQEQKK